MREDAGATAWDGLGLDRRGFLAAAGGSLAAVAMLPELGFARPIVSREKLRVGVIGVGRQGRDILAELQKLLPEQIVVKAVCDADERRAEAAKRRAAGVAVYTSHGQMLEREGLDAVVVATPTHTHASIVADAVSAGKHVYCEAPLASTAEDVRAIAATARRSGKVIACGFEGRSNPVYKLARTFFRSDSVRDLVSIVTQDNAKTSWRAAVSDPARERAVNWKLDPEVSLGLIGELGSHQLDVAQWYTEKRPVSVSGFGSIRLHNDGREVADTVSADFGLEHGPRLSYSATLASSYGGRSETFFGTNAAIKLAWSHGWLFKEADAPTQGWEVYANRQQFHKDEGITLIADATKLASQNKLKDGVGLQSSPLWYALEDFFRAVLDGTPVACPVDEGARTTLVAIKAAESVRRGVRVEISADDLRV